MSAMRGVSERLVLSLGGDNIEKTRINPPIPVKSRASLDFLS